MSNIEKTKKSDKRPKYTAAKFLEIYGRLPYDYQQLLSRAMLSMKAADPKYETRLVYIYIKYRLRQQYKSILSFSNELGDIISEESKLDNSDEYSERDYSSAVRDALKKMTQKKGGFYFDRIVNHLGITDEEIASLTSPGFAAETKSRFFFEALTRQNQALLYQVARELYLLLEFPEQSNTEYDEYEYDSIELPQPMPKKKRPSN